MKQKYHKAYLDMAIRFGQTSEATRRKVGALIVKDGCIISEGVNGQPPGYHTEVCEDEEGNTLPTVRHSEVAALEKLWNSTSSCKGADIYISCSPCLGCAIKLKTAGIRTVYYKDRYHNDDGYNYLIQNGITVHKI